MITHNIGFHGEIGEKYGGYSLLSGVMRDHKKYLSGHPSYLVL